MLAAGCAIGALLLLAAALVAANASGIVRDLSNDNAQALAGKAAAEVASDIGEIQGLVPFIVNPTSPSNSWT